MWSNFLFRLVIASGLSKFYDHGFILQEDELMIVSSQTIKQTAQWIITSFNPLIIDQTIIVKQIQAVQGQ